MIECKAGSNCCRKLAGIAVGEMCIRDREHCYQCLEKCDKTTIPYCITKALVNSAMGNTDEGLVFCGSNACKADRIETVEEVMKALVFAE